MPDDKQGGASEVISKSAEVAKTIQGAVKTGKAVAGIAKGAAAGGTYGAVAMGIWQNRKRVVKIILAASFILLLPILFILMLPALIFGGLNKDSPDIPVMNNNAVIYANIENVKDKVYAVIEVAHADVLKKIDDEIYEQPVGSENEIIDDYSSKALFDTTVMISQYQAYKDNYEEISVDDLVYILNQHKTELFSYTVTSVEKGVKTIKVVEKIVTEYIDSIVTDSQGNKTTVKTPVKKTVQETVEETQTKTVYTYTVTFAGSDYFADTVFKLSPEKKAYAEDLASNLTVFLNDRDNEGGA